MVDRRYDVEIAGHKYLVSRESGRYGRRSIPLQKAQQDTSGDVGEQSLNTEDLWRRSMSTWHRGAGQTWLDEEDSDRRRFRASLGVDPWTKKQLTLLSETEVKLASTASTVKLAVAGGYLYCADGQTLKYTTSITGAGAATWTTVTGTPAADATSITSDGYRVWVAYGSSGIYATTRGAAVASMWTDVPAESVAFVKGRLMVGYGPDVWNITSTARLGAPAFRGVSTDSSDALVNSKTVSYPAGTQPGDLLVAYVLTTGDGTDIDGWESLSGDLFVGAPSYQWEVFYRAAPDDGSTSFTVSKITATTARMLVVCVAYASVDTTSALGVSTTEDGTSTNAAPASEDLPVADTANALVLWAAIARGGSVTATPPTGVDFTGTMNERADIQTATASLSMSVNDIVLEFAEAVIGVITGNLSSGAFPSSPHVSAWAPATPPSVLFTQSTTDFTWVGFAEGQGDIYAAGYSGDKSLIYRTQVRADGTALDAPVVAGSLPDGEIVRSIYGYLGILFIGTDNGVRMAVSDANGDLTIGALIETASPVRCFEGQGRFVWFGLEDYDISRWGSGTYDGLGRLDLTQQTDQLVPAWASDLMATASTSTTESVQSVVTFQDRRLFSIGSSNALSRGVYGEKSTKLATGYLDSGLVSYGIADTKVATYADLRHRALAGTVTVYLSADEAAFVSIGASSSAGSSRTTDPLDAGPTRGDTHETRLVLARSATDTTTGPTVTRLTLRSEPAPARGEVLQWPLVLTKKLSVTGQERTIDPDEELLFIKGLFDAQTLVTCKQNAETFDAFLQDYEFMYEHRTDDKRTEQGICTVTLKVPAS